MDTLIAKFIACVLLLSGMLGTATCACGVDGHDDDTYLATAASARSPTHGHDKDGHDNDCPDSDGCDCVSHDVYVNVPGNTFDPGLSASALPSFSAEVPAIRTVGTAAPTKDFSRPGASPSFQSNRTSLLHQHCALII